MLQNLRTLALISTLIFPLIFFSSCEKDSDDKKQKEKLEEYSLDHFYSGISTLKIEVAYETGAKPIVDGAGGIFGSSPAWKLSKANIAALFQGRAVETEVSVPFTHAEMSEIPKYKQGDYDFKVLKEIAAKYMQGENAGAKGTIFLVFVDSYFSLNGKQEENVLGVAVSGTPYVAIFKPVINSISGESDRRNVEQATIIHEVGHALGLVDYGLPMTSEHKDEEHGAHCNNKDCVMYWAVAGKSAAASFANLIQGEETILFGAECLNDTRTYKP